MYMKVDHSQFELDGDRLTHKPTSAVFWMGENDVVSCQWGKTALASGYDYSREELMEAARQIFLQERTGCA